MINGVNLTEYERSLEEMERNGGTLRFVARASWINGLRHNVALREFPTLALDDIGALGGENSAPTPTELLLAACVGCFAVNFQRQLALADLQVADLQLEISAVIDLLQLQRQSGGGLENLLLRATVQSNGDQELLEALAERALSLSPVLNSLKCECGVAIIAR